MIRNKSESTAAYIEVREDTFDLTFLYQAPVIRVFNSEGMRDGRLLFNKT